MPVISQLFFGGDTGKDSQTGVGIFGNEEDSGEPKEH